ncbi:MAG TPA: serpin family protein [Pseudonocardiaceae bacterium]|nr:serpin family protein [Pseudonocardiaceae bacterium]
MPTTTVGRRVEHAHLAFTLAVQRELAGGGLSTACWSPYSVASALGLAATGARGSTRDELAALLMGSADAGLAEHGAMLTEAASLDAPDAVDKPVVGVANTLWHVPSLPIRDEFTQELTSWPNGSVRHAPFQTEAEAARGLVNADVADTTHDLIPELLDRGVIRPDTIAMLVNALYLKVAWRNRFPERATEERPFYGPTGPTDVRTMRLNKRLGYAATGGWQVVVLPAAGDVDAVVLLPDGDIAAAESTLDADALAGLLAAPVPALLHLHLPAFRVRAKAGLKAALAGLGVRTMFSNQADFGGISPMPMAVDSVVHEAVLTVDEEGLEGAAATAVVMRMLSMHRDLAQPIEVRVDRPFLFLVRHRPSGAVYFLARVVQP